jgi:hypothetical protein
MIGVTSLNKITERTSTKFISRLSNEATAKLLELITSFCSDMSLHLLEINLLKESFEIPAPILAILDIKSVEDPL